MSQKQVGIFGDVVLGLIGVLMVIIGFFCSRTLSQLDNSIVTLSMSMTDLKVTVEHAITEQTGQRNDINSLRADVEDLKKQVREK